MTEAGSETVRVRGFGLGTQLVLVSQRVQVTDSQFQDVGLFQFSYIFTLLEWAEKNQVKVSSYSCAISGIKGRRWELKSVLTVCRALVISSFNSSRQRLIRALLFLSSIGFITFRYWYVLDTGSAVMLLVCIMYVCRFGAIINCKSRCGSIDWSSREKIDNRVGGYLINENSRSLLVVDVYSTAGIFLAVCDKMWLLEGNAKEWWYCYGASGIYKLKAQLCAFRSWKCRGESARPIRWMNTPSRWSLISTSMIAGWSCELLNRT